MHSDRAHGGSRLVVEPIEEFEVDGLKMKQLAATMVDFDPRFGIMPGTNQGGTVIAKHHSYAAVPGAPLAE